MNDNGQLLRMAPPEDQRPSTAPVGFATLELSYEPGGTGGAVGSNVIDFCRDHIACYRCYYYCFRVRYSKNGNCTFN